VASGELTNPQEVLTSDQLKRYQEAKASTKTVVIKKQEEIGNPATTVKKPSLTWKYKIFNTRDFAWASSKAFIWDGAKISLPSGKAAFAQSAYPVESATPNGWTRSTEFTRTSIENYSKRWFEFPYPAAVNVASNVSGMEYPGIVFCGWKDVGEDLWGVTDHEFGHTWFPMIVGSNERRYGWMDEGFNEYMNILSDADTDGKPYILDGLGQSYGQMSGDENEAPMMWSANDAGSGYRFQTYQKAPLMLSMLGGIVGDQAVINAMKKYTAAWAYKHPSPWDYIFFMNNELGQDLEWFWYYWLWTTETVEGSIQDVKIAGSKTTVSVHQAGQMPSPVVLKVEFEAAGPAIKTLPNAKMIDATTAEVTWPVSVWLDGKRTFDAEMNFGKRKIKKITFDPHGRFPDSNPADNVWPRK
jgi:hypothetical protein